ncbi:MAG: Gfo/Idh/MocA family protein [Bacillota bacterium]
MAPLRFAVLGAGGRGQAYGDYLLRYPQAGAVTAVADPDEERLRLYAAKHRIQPSGLYPSWEALLEARPAVDAVIITTQDRMHTAPALRALELGYDVLLEKPMSPEPAEVAAIAEAAERHGRTLMVCHVLRYTPFMQAVKRLLDSGVIGRLVSVQWTENVGWYHVAHSYVRGNWRRTAESSPMILAKSCHDLDLIHWLVGEPCLQVSSFGSLMHFRPENAPPGATARCTDGCPAEPNCPYSALKIYMGNGPDWVVWAATADPSPEGRLRALQEGPYGRCVYHCDNDVVDHQVVNLAYQSGLTVSFSMVGFSREITRTAKLFGTHGEMRIQMERNEIEINDFNGRQTVVRPEILPGGHNGGDTALMRAFVQQVQTKDPSLNLSPARVSAETHLLAFAAEESRLTGRTIDFQAYARRFDLTKSDQTDPMNG